MGTLYIDDLVIISDKMEDLVEKLNTWIEDLKMKGLRVNMQKQNL